MQLTLTIGNKTVEITTPWEEHEEDNTWGTILGELMFPALRGFGYIIDETWSESLEEDHREFCTERRWNKR